MPERRKATRQKSFLRGCIYFNNRRSAFDCLIRDTSATGARLIFSDTITVPDVVELYIPQKDQTLRAEVHWRHGNELGVAFTQGAAGASDQASQPADVNGRLDRLETEIASLKKIIKQLKAAREPNEDAA